MAWGQGEPTLIQAGHPQTIPGCGISGCYAPYRMCVDVPAGSTPIDIVAYHDSFAGWGDFGGKERTATGFCATYLQHSHNVTRIVSFDVSYRPMGSVPITSPPESTANLLAAEKDFAAKAEAGTPVVYPASGVEIGARTITGKFLERQLIALKGNAAIKDKGLEIENAEISGDVAIGRTTFPYNLRFKNCHFAKRLSFNDSRFERSLEFDGSRFDEGLVIEDVAVKGDILISLHFPPPGDKSFADNNFQLNRIQVDGRTQISAGLAEKPVSLTVDSVKTRDMSITSSTKLALLSVQNLDADALRISSTQRPSDAEILSLFLTGDRIKNILDIKGMRVDTLKADRTEIGGEFVLSEIAVTNTLDLSFSKINALRWSTNRTNFPARNDGRGVLLTGLVFRNLQVTQSGHVEPRGAEDPLIWQYPPDSVESFDASIKMLHSASYSASAFDSFEQLLSSRGESAHAEDVFVAGRHERRRSDVVLNNPVTWIGFAGDWLHEYILGYGRIARWPVIWSLVIICAGAYLFRNQSSMYSQAEHGDPPPYSPMWYSVELFLPVVDLGVAKSWRPAKGRLAMYARFHQLSGWVLIPVALAAITGLTH